MFLCQTLLICAAKYTTENADKRLLRPQGRGGKSHNAAVQEVVLLISSLQPHRHWDTRTTKRYQDGLLREALRYHSPRYDFDVAPNRPRGEFRGNAPPHAIRS